MKRIYLILCVIFNEHLFSQDCNLLAPQDNGITKCLVDKLGCNPKEVEKIGDPYLYSGECSIAIDRILARAGNYQGLTELIYPIRNENGVIVDCENAGFCPERYCEVIMSMLDLQISFVKNAFFGASYHEHQLFPEDCWYEVGKQIVNDINYAFDCKGLPRPVIGGTAFEVFDGNNFNNNAIFTDIDRSIPRNIISEYFNCFSDDLNIVEDGIKNSDYYFEADGKPKSNIFFDKDRVIEINGSNLDIGRTECRIFLLWQALTQIDMGYNAIHMGIYWSYAKSSENEYSILSRLTDCIREYARKKGTFVVISGETPMQDIDNGFSAKVPGTERFIFDFDSRAMRPRELNSLGDGNWPNGCDGNISDAFVKSYQNSPCFNNASNIQCPDEIMAIIDPCTINSFGGSVGGYSASNPDCWLTQQPYSVHFDGHSFDEENLCSPSNGPSSLTYGLSDNNWFGNLSDDCKAWWFNYFYCDRRQFHDGNGFLEIPATIYSWYNPRKLSLLTKEENPIFFSNLKNNTLAPKEPNINIKEIPSGYSYKSCECNGAGAPINMIWNIEKKCYSISITNIDCSSKYSIHIKDPEGVWLPQTLGNSTTFCPEKLGIYKIGIRQDNLGLWKKMDFNFGTKTKDYELYVDQIETCILSDGPCRGKYQLKMLAGANTGKDINVYPNPVNGLLNIENLESNIEEILIFSAAGVGQQCRFALNNPDDSIKQLDFGNLLPGIYFVKIIHNNVLRTFRIAKI